MKNRIQQLMQVQHMNQLAFSNLTGISTATLSNILNGKTNPTMVQVSALMKTFPTLDSRWLMFGEGEMFTDNSTNGTSSVSHTSGEIQDNENNYLNNTDNMAEHVQSSNTQLDLFSVGQNSTTRNSHPITSSALQRQQVASVQPNTSRMQSPQMQISTHGHKITEIRVYYDDQTWESFTPKK